MRKTPLFVAIFVLALFSSQALANTNPGDPICGGGGYNPTIAYTDESFSVVLNIGTTYNHTWSGYTANRWVDKAVLKGYGAIGRIDNILIDSDNNGDESNVTSTNLNLGYPNYAVNSDFWDYDHDGDFKFTGASSNPSLYNGDMTLYGIRIFYYECNEPFHSGDITTIPRPLLENDEFILPDSQIIATFSRAGYTKEMVSDEWCNGVYSLIETEAGTVDCTTFTGFGSDETLYPTTLLYDVDPNLWFSYSNEPDAPVRSGIDGTVVSFKLMDNSQCTRLTAGTDSLNATWSGADPCYNEIPNYLTDALALVYEADTTGINDGFWLVTIEEDETGEFYYYLVTNRTVQLGDSVSVGCILGETVPIKQQVVEGFITDLALLLFDQIIPISDISDLFKGYSEDNPAGFTAVGHRATAPEDVITDEFDAITLVNYPPDEAPCNTSAGSVTGCLSINPRFANNGEYWTTIPSEGLEPTFMNPGVILDPGTGVVMQDLPIDVNIQYGASVQVFPTSKSGTSLEITIGNTVFNEIQIDTSNYSQTYNLEPQTIEPSYGDKAHLKIVNTSDKPIWIDYFCLNEGSETAPPDTDCLVLNSDFDLGLQYWYFQDFNTQSNTTFKKGNDNVYELWHKEDLYVAVNITGTYTIYIEYYPYFSLNDISLISVSGNNLGSYNILLDNSKNSIFSGQKLTASADVLFNGYTSLHFYYKAKDYTETDLASNVKDGILISKICIDINDNFEPGTDETGGVCSANPQPANSASVQVWLNWHWNNFNSFFQCELMPLLQDILKIITEFFNFFKDGFQWAMYSAQAQGKWLGSDLLPWLAGYLTNISPGTVNVNNECGNIFCALLGIVDGLNSFINTIGQVISDAIHAIETIISQLISPILNFLLQILTMALELIFTVLINLIALAFLLIGQFVDFVFYVLGLISSIITSWSTAEPTALPGLWDCATQTHEVCKAHWVIDNTVLSGDAGALIVPLMAAVMWAMLALKIIKDVKNGIVESGKVS